MNRVLVITYYWPPSGGAGVQRWLKFAKYLRGFGWEPVIYTPENPEFPEHDNSLIKDVPEETEVVKTPIWEPYNFYKQFSGQNKHEKIQTGFLSVRKKNKLIENLSVWIRGNLFIPDARKFWIRPSIRFLTKYLRENPVDAIVSTGPPHSMHLIALGIKKETGLPWLADFRDPWTGIDFYHKLKLTGIADRRHHRLENEVLNTADRVSVVSWNWADDLSQLVSRKYDVVTNGFDPGDFNISTSEISQAFELTHVGSLNRDRNPELLWEAISELCAEHIGFCDHLRLRFIGKCDISLDESLIRHGLQSRTERIEYMNHDKVIMESASSQVLLLLLNNTPNVMGIVPGKIFEYLASRRPVFCMGPEDGDSARIIRESGAGVVCNFDDKSGIKQALLSLYNQYLNGSLSERKGNIDAFSRKELACKIGCILGEMVSGSRNNNSK